ncbi:hypothetical protein [Nocardioides sp. P86]|uniref:AAA family ATPase n=1 Tax=Nocardioides sp. P86 TaxID=2939569 RepID=UPI00203F77F8|nr:hypothetical protein [Nocardioides sp. P86]MCM3514317.1 hypothetical protein [Nocardioides sp. P86]
MPDRTAVVLVVASGAAWESPALQHLNARPGVVVLKRCVDVDDLLASAAAGQADVAVLGLDSPGLDLAAVDHLRRHGVRPVAVVPSVYSPEAARLRASRIAISSIVPETRLDSLPEAVTAPEEPPPPTRPAGGGDPVPAAPTAPRPAPSEPESARDRPAAAPASPSVPGRVVTVWGPAGAPGRTTIAAGLAAVLAGRGARTVLVDADPQGGAVAQQLGILDEVSGLLAAARLASAGMVEERFASVQRSLGPHLSVVTGLPRADRWAEVRAGALEHLLEVGREQAQVVVDTGASLEGDLGAELSGRPGRNHLTLAAVDVADTLVVVGTPDPVGLSRLARGLAELHEHTGGRPVHVVVNRMRSTLGWSEKDVAAMVAGFGRVEGLHFLPDDRAGVDRALVAGRTLTESGDTPLVRALAPLADALVPDVAREHASPRPGRGARARRRTR